MRHERLVELEGVRALMAWWVVAGHIGYFFSDRAGDLIHNNSAVFVFMALSGFVITGLIEDRRERYEVYLMRRVLRLWPAYLIALALTAATLPLQASALIHAPFHPRFADFRLANIAASLHQFWPHLAAHVLLAQGLVPDSVLHGGAVAVLGQAWSLSVEFQFYLIAPLLVGLISLGRTGVAGASAIGVYLYVLGVYGPMRDNTAFIGAYAPWFAFGIASFYLWRGRERASAGKFVGGFCAVVAAFGLATREPAALVWIVILITLFRGGALRRLLTHPILKRLGEASYSTYLFHMLALFLSAGLLNAFALDRWVYLAALAALTVVATLVASFLSYRLVEKPAMRLGVRLPTTGFAVPLAPEIAAEAPTGS